VTRRHVPLGPRCGKPVKATQLARQRAFNDPDPVCGRPLDHSELGGCMSEEAYTRLRDLHRIAIAARRSRAAEQELAA